MLNDIDRVLFSESDIAEAVKRIGMEITNDYQDKDLPILIGLLKGCQPFMGDLAKEIKIPIEIDYISVDSYDGKESRDIRIKKDLDSSVLNRNVIIAEDIVDTGKTLDTITNLLYHRGAKSVEVATLLDKPEGRLVPFNPKYVGLLIPNEFVVGYGLDYNNLYRNLPFIGVLKKEVYEGGK